MSLQVEQGAFDGLSDAMHQIKESGFWPTTFVAGVVDGTVPHWHDHEVQAYVMEGSASFLDHESDTNHKIGKGDKLTIPKGTVHAEGALQGRVVYLIAVPEPLTPAEFLKQRSPDEL